MSFIDSIFIEHTALQAVVIISLIATLGTLLGRIRVAGISLGATFIFFVGILAGHLGFTIDPQMLNYAESFGLILFVYALGLQVGPSFFASMRSGGAKLVLLASTTIILGTALIVSLGFAMGISIDDISGILCGATTNTPALGAAQQGLKDLGLESKNIALACALTYPFGVVGVILSLALLRRCVVRPSELPEPDAEHTKNIYIVGFKVTNPGIFNKCIREIVAYNTHKFVISRLWRDGAVSIPTSDKSLQSGDNILVITAPEDVATLEALFGERHQKDWNEQNIDWNEIDSNLISQRIVVTHPDINGRKLSSLRLRNNYGINISRVYRSGVQLIPTPDLTLQIGDRLTVVGEQAAIHNVERKLGNAVKHLDEPHLVSVFIGIIVGLIFGAIPFSIPGISVPVKLGLAGGPIIMGILIGTFGPRLHIITYTTQSANLMLRSLGLSVYLACLGLDAGAHFFETVMRPEGALWLGLGAITTVVPVIIMAIVSLRIFKLDFGTVAGLMSGSMANPMALNYANETLEGDKPAVAYATVYPITMFLRVIVVQIILMLFL